jgi:hypothetical protein
MHLKSISEMQGQLQIVKWAVSNLKKFSFMYLGKSQTEYILAVLNEAGMVLTHRMCYCLAENGAE